MQRIQLLKEIELDINTIKKKLKDCKIIKTTHIPEVESRKGRPEWSFVENYLKNKSDKLYKVLQGRKERTILLYFLSSKYELRVVARFAKKTLYVVTYYKHKKRFKR